MAATVLTVDSSEAARGSLAAELGGESIERETDRTAVADGS